MICYFFGEIISCIIQNKKDRNFEFEPIKSLSCVVNEPIKIERKDQSEGRNVQASICPFSINTPASGDLASFLKSQVGRRISFIQKKQKIGSIKQY